MGEFQSMSIIPHPEIELALQRLDGELRAAGVRYDSVASDNSIFGINPADEALAALVVAAKGKALASTECQAVKTALGAASPQWAAYQAVRQAWKESKRTERLLVEVVTMIVELFYTATPRVVAEGIFLGFNQAKLVAAKARIDEIRAAYPDEE